mgnify:FL=1
MGLPMSMIMAGGAMQAVSAFQQGEAANKAAKINARRSAEEASQQELELHEQRKKIAGQNRTIVAKSGVRVEGSPNSVMAHNDLKALRMSQRLRRRSHIEQTMYGNQARAARYAGRVGVGTSLISTAGTSLLFRDNPLAAGLTRGT